MQQQDILSDIIESVRQVPDHQIDTVTMGSHLVSVTCSATGLASCHGPHGSEAPAPVQDLPQTGHALARWLLNPPPTEPQARSLGLAAVNAMLPAPKDPLEVKGQDLIVQHGQDRHVAVIGHFPFVERLSDKFATLSVLELNPRLQDLPASQADEVLPKADVVAITGTTLLNGTLAGLLGLCRPEAFVIMLGPSTPFAPSLFELGVNALAGCVVSDPGLTGQDIRKGLPFKALRGAKPLIWVR